VVVFSILVQGITVRHVIGRQIKTSDLTN
jgi:hypothetical protein